MHSVSTLNTAGFGNELREENAEPVQRLLGSELLKYGSDPCENIESKGLIDGGLESGVDKYADALLHDCFKEALQTLFPEERSLHHLADITDALGNFILITPSIVSVRGDEESVFGGSRVSSRGSMAPLVTLSVSEPMKCTNGPTLGGNLAQSLEALLSAGRDSRHSSQHHNAWSSHHAPIHTPGSRPVSTHPSGLSCSMDHRGLNRAHTHRRETSTSMGQARSVDFFMRDSYATLGEFCSVYM